MSFAGPKISSPAQVYSFGVTNQVQELPHTFTIKNSGESVLEITKVKACCGATAKMDVKSIKPGEEAKVDVTLINLPESGSVRKTISLMTNDPSQPIYMLTVEGTIKGSGVGATKSSAGPIAQKDCPFKPEPIQKQFFHDHKDIRIYTCCPECLVVVKANPELAIRRLSEKNQRPILVKDAE